MVDQQHHGAARRRREGSAVLHGEREHPLDHRRRARARPSAVGAAHRGDRGVPRRRADEPWPRTMPAGCRACCSRVPTTSGAAGRRAWTASRRCTTSCPTAPTPMTPTAGSGRATGAGRSRSSATTPHGGRDSRASRRGRRPPHVARRLRGRHRRADRRRARARDRAPTRPTPCRRRCPRRPCACGRWPPTAGCTDAGVTVTASSEGGGGGAFAGPVAAAAERVELTRDGVLLDSRTRSQAPRVSVLAPRRGTRVRARRSFTVRWRASDPEQNALQATVDVTRTVAPGARSTRAPIADGRSSRAGTSSPGATRAYASPSTTASRRRPRSRRRSRPRARRRPPGSSAPKVASRSRPEPVSSSSATRWTRSGDR